MCETIKDIKTNKIQFRQTQNGSQLDTQQMLSLPIFNTSPSYDDNGYTPVKKLRGRNLNQGPPSTPRYNTGGAPTPRNNRSDPNTGANSGRRKSFYQQA